MAADKNEKKPKRRYSSLSSLDCWPEVRQKILEGTSPQAVARYIHSRGEYTHAKEASIVRAIQRWAQTADFPRVVEVLPAKTQSSVLDVIQERFDDLPQRVGERLDVIFESEQLIIKQRDRLDDALALEKTAGLIFPSLNQEVKLLARMLNDHVQILMEMGIVPRAPAQYQHLVLGVQARVGASDVSPVIEAFSSLPSGGIEMLLQLEHMLDGRNAEKPDSE